MSSLLIDQEEGQRLAPEVGGQGAQERVRDLGVELSERPRVDLLGGDLEEHPALGQLQRQRRGGEDVAAEVALGKGEEQVGGGAVGRGPADAAGGDAEARQDLPDGERLAHRRVGAPLGDAEPAPQRQAEPGREQPQVVARAEESRREDGVLQHPVDVGQLPRGHRRPQGAVVVRSEAPQPAVGAALHHGREERQMTLPSERQDRVEGRALDADDEQARTRLGLDRRRQRRRHHRRLEGLPALDQEPDRDDRQQREAHPRAEAVRPPVDAVEQGGVEEDQRRQGEPERRLDQPHVDAGRDEEGEVGGVDPVAQRREGEDDRHRPRQQAAGPPRAAARERSQERRGRQPQRAAEEQDAAQQRLQGERQVGVEKEQQRGDLGAGEEPGQEVVEEVPPEGGRGAGVSRRGHAPSLSAPGAVRARGRCGTIPGGARQDPVGHAE